MKTQILSGVLLLAGFSSLAQTDTTVQNDTTVATTITSVQANTAFAEEKPQPVYKIKKSVDIPLTIAATAWGVYGMKEIYSKPDVTPAHINRVIAKKSDINGFDRWATDVYHEKAAATSDILFYGSMPLPLLLLADKDIRKDGGKIMFLYFQTMTITGIYYTGSAFFVDRYRPYVYNPNAAMDDKVEGVARNSFLAGHPALVGTSTFFIAKVFKDYHPDSPLRHWLFAGAGLATGATAYLRHRAGRHFPSDLILGTTLGTLTGILVPHFHKNKLFKNKDVSIIPFSGRSHGLHVVYNF
jgi:membrane-associated phospholipid phosphatase